VYLFFHLFIVRVKGVRGVGWGSSLRWIAHRCLRALYDRFLGPPAAAAPEPPLGLPDGQPPPHPGPRTPIGTDHRIQDSKDGGFRQNAMMPLRDSILRLFCKQSQENRSLWSEHWTHVLISNFFPLRTVISQKGIFEKSMSLKRPSNFSFPKSSTFGSHPTAPQPFHEPFLFQDSASDESQRHQRPSLRRANGRLFSFLQKKCKKICKLSMHHKKLSYLS